MILFMYLTLLECDSLISYYLHQAVDLLLRWFKTIFKSKSPGIDQWGHSNIKGAICFIRYPHCQLEHV